MAKEKKRTDSYRRVLRQGESQRANGKYDYRWTDKLGKRHSIYADTLDELREKEDLITRDTIDGIKSEKANVTVNEVFSIWCDLKRGLKDNTKQNYIYMYKTFVASSFGKLRLSNVKRSDVKRFYNTLADEYNLQIATIDNIHTVLHQVLQLAVDDDILRKNPSDNVLKELKQAHNFETTKKKALTVEEQKLFMDFLSKSHKYNHWYPIFAVMLCSGLRVGECTGLRWCDVDLKEKTISVNHTLVYYNHAENGCYFAINTPKTEAGKREVPMLSIVKDALLQERKNQMAAGIRCTATVNGYEDFIFVNRFGNVQHQGTLNKALRRIIRDCNDEILLKGEENPVLLPRFSCHNLRHTFATRLCEADVNIKVIQDTLGHKDISTTMEIYAEATKNYKQKELGKMEVNDDLWAIQRCSIMRYEGINSGKNVYATIYATCTPDIRQWMNTLQKDIEH